ncbi:hypothetical protein [Vibrio tritonius]|uniref:hypothetical protein n=1 Tax=Vibrio tritonius TaxID=1435069 RepID=UPI00315DA726
MPVQSVRPVVPNSKSRYLLAAFLRLKFGEGVVAFGAAAGMPVQSVRPVVPNLKKAAIY